jgi:hypothetical protein
MSAVDAASTNPNDHRTRIILSAARHKPIWSRGLMLVGLSPEESAKAIRSNMHENRTTITKAEEFQKVILAAFLDWFIETNSTMSEAVSMTSVRIDETV